MPVNLKGKLANASQTSLSSSGPTMQDYSEHFMSTEAVGHETVTQVSGKDTKKETVVKSEETHIPGNVMATAPQQRLSLALGRTLNMQNYESTRIDVRLEAPCTEETREQVYDWMSEWVSGKLMEAEKAAKGLA